MADTLIDDAQLARDAGRGDQDAFAVLYERYYDQLYDFAYRTVHDSDSAADVVQMSLTKAWQQLQGGEAPQSIKSWLFTVTRNSAIDELRRRKRLAYSDEDDESEEGVFALVSASSEGAGDPEQSARNKEMAELVWSSAATLSEREYTLLDMHVRRGLTAEELALSMGVQRGNVYTMLSRLKDSVEESVSATLLARQAPRICQELNSLLNRDGFDGHVLSKSTRRVTSRHARTCPSCQQARARYISAEEMFAGLAPVPAIGGAKEAGMLRLRRETSSGRGTSERRAAGSSGWAWPLSRRVAAVALILLLLLLLTAGAAAFGAFGGTDSPAVAMVKDPDDVHSTTHQINVPSTEAVIRMEWTQKTDAKGYSVLWSLEPVALPDNVASLAGDASTVSSPPRTPGTWYFHMRTQGQDGRWTSTVHAGPYVVQIAAAPTATLVPPTATPPPPPTLTPTPEPPTPTPRPPVQQSAPSQQQQPVVAPTQPAAIPPTQPPRPSETPPPTQPPAPTPQPPIQRGPIGIEATVPGNVPQIKIPLPDDKP